MRWEQQPDGHRPRPWLALAVLVLLAVLAGCGDDGGSGAGGQTSTPSVEAAFPVSVDHAFGTTEIPARPERIVTVGLTEQDVVLALGQTPVGVTDWYGDRPYAVWPWAQDELGDAKPEVLHTTDGFEYEKIAALRPDLIIGTNAGIEQDSYDRLTKIAPTIAHAEGAEGYFSHWRDQTLTIGRSLGLEDEAQTLVDGIDEQFAAAVADHPEFAGKQIVFLQNAIYDGEAIAYQEGLNTQFLTDLGFEIPSVLDDFVREAEGSQAFIPLEQLSVLDEADLLMWATEKEEDVTALEAEPLYNDLEAVQAGNLVFTDGLSAGAIYFTSVLSLPLVLDKVVPALAQVVAGEGPVTAAAIPPGMEPDERD